MLVTSFSKAHFLLLLQQELNLPLQASRLGRLQSDEKIALKVAL